MKNLKKAMVAGCCAALLASGGVFSAIGGVITVGEAQQAPMVAPDSVLVWGQIRGVEQGKIYLDNISGNSSPGDMTVNIIEESTRVLDAVDGLPVALTDLKVGDFIYAYLGPTMTMSLPPMVNAQMIICKAPADMKVPEYIRVTTVATGADGSVTLKASNGKEYQAPADCTILPYLTRNMVTLQNIEVGSTCMIWTDDAGKASKIVLFAPERGVNDQGGLVGPGENLR